MEVYLWSEDFGYVKATGDQWTDDKGVMWGSFHTNLWGAHVNLRMSEVIIDRP
jgi:hypothetical protein